MSSIKSIQTDFHSFQFDAAILKGFEFKPSNQVYSHEEVIKERKNALTKYLWSLYPKIIVPSILVCSESMVIIDGHHRYHSLKSMGLAEVPVTLIDYSSPIIVTDENNSLNKSLIIESGINNKLLPPKTTAHHIIGLDNNIYPTLLISTLSLIDFSKLGIERPYSRI